MNNENLAGWMNLMDAGGMLLGSESGSANAYCPDCMAEADEPEEGTKYIAATEAKGNICSCCGRPVDVR